MYKPTPKRKAKCIREIGEQAKITQCIHCHSTRHEKIDIRIEKRKPLFINKNNTHHEDEEFFQALETMHQGELYQQHLEQLLQLIQ